ncbi:hypothetical protein [Niallia circulans]|uniref:hypothetical protein n=1 Tax=Niallia circulans TaxID=1397 RepID=UPI0035120EF4
MPQQRIYHEYVDNTLVPYWYVLTFDNCEINWDKQILYYDAIAPFEFIERDEFDESIASFSVHLSDFVINKDRPLQLGLNLRSIRKRILKYGVDPYIIRQFIIQIPDINDVLKLIPNSRKIKYIID